MLITILFTRAFALGKALVGHIIWHAFTLSPVLLVEISASPWASAFPGTLSSGHGWTGTAAQGAVRHTRDQPCSPIQVLLLLSAGRPPGNPNLCSPELLSAAWAAGGREGIWEMLSPGSESAVCVRERIPRDEWAFVWMLAEKGFLSFLPKALFGYLERLFLVEHH